MIEFSKRIEGLSEYYFSSKLREVKSLIDSGEDIINLGIGSPDLSPPTPVIKKLKDSLNVTGAHKYQSYIGVEKFRKEISNFYKLHYNCDLNYQSEILPLIGSKEGIFHISMSFLSEDDKVLIPNPGYPTYSSITKLIGNEIIYYDLNEKNNWLPDLEQLTKLDLSSVKIMWINYPHMPTGAKATAQDLEKMAAFGLKHDILICNDNPYSFILNDKYESLLKRNQYKSNILELNSLSKSHNMAGWRIGMVAGEEHLINAILKVKSNMDSGMFYAIQKAATKALFLNENWFVELNSTYEKRRAIAWEIYDELNLSYSKSAAGLFIWGKINSSTKNDLEFTDELLHNNGVFITPGSIFGSNGKNYLRLSLCVKEQTLKEILRRLKNR
ncbi:MAG: aminotransferase [Flavobacteriaceae bacterium]|nr:aminotransferase [Flavobacteriaceae bacterium]